MSTRRVGLWLIGALGGVASTAVLGISALSRKLTDTTSLVTATPMFDGIDLDDWPSIVIGGHDIRQSSYAEAVRDLNQRSNVFNEALIQACQPDLDQWTANICPGTVLGAGTTIGKLADMPEVKRVNTPREAIERVQADLRDFKARNKLDQLVVANVSSTEPPKELDERYDSVLRFATSLEATDAGIPASALYAWAALDLGIPYINFTPSLGASFPAAIDLANERKTTVSGKDGKTGETMMKTVLAPMFAYRNFRILSWVGHNIFGNRDAVVLDDPVNRASKIQTKDKVISSIVGYKPQTHVSIEYIQSLDDWKTAWDHIHFQGFLNTKMILQFLWQGCDSLLAAPLLLDIVRLTLLAQRRGEVGILSHLACFFKSPMGCDEHDFFKQMEMLAEYADKVR
ncbi:MAG: myo-inositol-1-phosphate synthase [Planctomycetes bacterium]|nr:myo-inositol-1-phosphate synthase [Planctomycetota bacterium]